MVKTCKREGIRVARVEGVVLTTLTKKIITKNGDPTLSFAFEVYPCPVDWEMTSWLSADIKLSNHLRRRAMTNGPCIDFC